jgi:hypothetical protein
MHTFVRSEESHIEVTREPVEGRCESCGARELKSYRVLSEGGWWNVVKCQRCLSSARRERANPYGDYTPLGAPR